MTSVREWIEYGCAEAGYPELASRISYEWNKRFTRRLGDARYCKYTRRGYIRLSWKLWPTMKEKDQINTILHEVAHIVHDYVYGPNPVNGGHSIAWKRIAKQIGARPVRYANRTSADFARFRRRTTRYTVSCNCTTHVISKHIYTKMKNGTRNYKCNYCGEVLDWRRANEILRTIQ